MGNKLNNKNIKDVNKFAKMTAKHKNWKLNPDKVFLDGLTEGLLTSFNTYGYFNCPCREAWGNREKDNDIICPCDYSYEDIKEYGHCYCALFMSEEFVKSGKEPESIPERRNENLFPE